MMRLPSVEVRLISTMVKIKLISNFLTYLSFSEKLISLVSVPIFPHVGDLSISYKEWNYSFWTELIFGASLLLPFIEYLLCARHIARAFY